MVYEYDITATIVLYHEDLDVLQRTVDCFLKTTLEQKRLFLVDNTADRRFKEILSSQKRIRILCYREESRFWGRAQFGSRTNKRFFQLSL